MQFTPAIHVFVALSAVFVAFGCSPDQEQNPKLEKVMDLVRAKLETEERLREDIVRLGEKYRGADTDPLYEPADLASDAGLADARVRLNKYLGLMQEWRSALDRKQIAWGSRIRASDLPEPYGSRLKRRHADSEPLIVQSQLAWDEGVRAYAFSVEKLFGFAERHIEVARLEDGELVFDDPSLQREYNELRQFVLEAERRSNAAHRAALEMDDETTALLREAIVEFR